LEIQNLSPENVGVHFLHHQSGVVSVSYEPSLLQDQHALDVSCWHSSEKNGDKVGFDTRLWSILSPHSILCAGFQMWLELLSAGCRGAGWTALLPATPPVYALPVHLYILVLKWEQASCA